MSVSTSPVYRIGSKTITVVSDGVIWLDAGAVFGLVPKVMWSRVTGETNALNQIPLALNCLLLESDGKTVLIETGQGDKDFEQTRRRGWEPDHGKLLDDLARNGVQAADVDIVINTHLHNDHTGWNTVSRGESLQPTFPNARYWIQRGEWEEAMHPNERTRATYLAENLVPVQGRRPDRVHRWRNAGHVRYHRDRDARPHRQSRLSRHLERRRVGRLPR